MSIPTVTAIYPEPIFDGTNGPQLREAIDAAIQAGAKIILVNFEKTTFIDSSGLGALVLALKAIHATENVKLYLCSLNEQCRMIFELTRVNSIFEIFEDESAFQQAVLEGQT